MGSQRPATNAASLATPQSSGLCSACTHPQPQPHSHSRCESKSSKQSLSSACTQLTSLSPEEEVGSGGGGAYEGRQAALDHAHHGHPGHPGHAPGHGHGHGVLASQWESGCVQCAQEAALLTSQLAGQEPPSGRLSQQRVFGYPYMGYMGAYEGYPQYSDCQAVVGVAGVGVGVGVARSGQRTNPGSLHYGSGAQHSPHYAPPSSAASSSSSSAAASHYRSHYAAHGSHYGAPPPPLHHSSSQGVYYSSQSAHYYPGHQYASQAQAQAAYGGAHHYRSAGHYAPGVQPSSSSAGPHHHSPVTLSLSTSSSSSSPSQPPGMSLKLNRSVSHESGSMYPACASPRGPDYASGGGSQQKAAGRSPNRSLIPLVTTKLSAEGIILTDEPYSTPVSQSVHAVGF